MIEYKFTPYDKRFLGLFMQEKAKLKKILYFAKTIEHFGSTSVPGLGGKGIIDIYILIPKEKIDLSKKKLIRSGYSFYNIKEMDGGLKMIFRRVYKYKDKERKVNIHIGTIGIKDFEKCIYFRDCLRNDKDMCVKYEEVKKRAITKTKNFGEDSKENSQIYVEAKENFIKKYNIV